MFTKNKYIWYNINMEKDFIGENWTKTVLLFLFIMSADMHSLRFHLSNWIAEDSRLLS